ncbi:transposase [Mogibacterium timidum]|uniref:transposase n=1 Tax=Mogibacterium timidum TaxID=35519 RepID=UPI00248AD897|nr:transposase [Mogibacterium timidum]
MKYDKEFKLQALQLSDEIGVKAAAEQLGFKYYTLAEWRKSRTRHGDDAFVGSGHKAVPLFENERRIRELEQELREIKRANEILKEALGFFAISRKK